MLKIAVCNHRNNSKYKNQEKPWSYIKDRNRRPIRTTETAEEYPRLPKEKRDELKDHGGFVGGWLKGGIRKNGNVISRCIGALDADNIGADDDFLGITRKALEGVEYFIYSTHKHRPEAPRYRIVILFDREVSEDEYPALMRMVARQIGMDFFDDSTYQSNRMMYWSSCPSNGVFFFEEGIGEPMAVNRYLGMYADWRDTTQWPTSSRQSEVVKHSVRQQQDPLSKDGLIGAFCRTYFPITEAIHTFLSDVYAPSATEGRYDYIPADSNAGVVIYDDKFVYSHHATDPACEKLLNAFDLVRIHLFGDDDPKKTYKQMCDLALQQDAVKLTLDRERRERADEDFAADDDRDWTSQLRYQPRSQILENSVWNLMLILNNDPDFANFGYNELANRVQVTGPVPWDRPTDNKFWRDADTAQLKALLDTRYVSFSSRNHDVCFAKVADDRRFHPIRDYLDSLPPWDGECRVESLFIRCLEADDTEYVRTVTRRLFAAAVARVYQPGIKFDCLTVIDGAQGIGKSTLLKELVGDEYYSETLSLTDMDDKTGAEKLQGYWVIEIGELAGMKKADVEKVKGFLSTTDDKYRPSYGRVVESHPRQCVVIATVNGERGYLRDITGNRRFWIIKCRQKEQARKWSFTKEERDQIWAEAVALWRGGEKLYLEDTELPAAEALQREAMELDERQGIVEEYLNTLLPDNWDGMDLYERRNYLSVQYDPTQPRGTTVRKAVSNVEIWAECFGKNPSEMKPADSYAIAALMMRVEGWERTEKIRRIPVYGRQRLYLKTE
ncbi:MAG: hypothetical protein IKL25_03760 [Clostridia bacterium]|nr:hypothetical protein [Clostridia bacterium]